MSYTTPMPVRELIALLSRYEEYSVYVNCLEMLEISDSEGNVIAEINVSVEHE